MRHGGRRPGAGRKPSLHAGAAKVRLRTREMIDQAAAEGVTPIAILLGTMRHLWAEAHRDGKPDLAIMKEACSIASQAAPFVHPRLASLAAKVETISGISDGALDLRLAAVLDTLDALVAPEEDDEPKALPAPVDEAAE